MLGTSWSQVHWRMEKLYQWSRLRSQLLLPQQYVVIRLAVGFSQRMLLRRFLFRKRRLYVWRREDDPVLLLRWTVGGTIRSSEWLAHKTATAYIQKEAKYAQSSSWTLLRTVSHLPTESHATIGRNHLAQDLISLKKIPIMREVSGPPTINNDAQVAQRVTALLTQLLVLLRP